jgi:hypothetical protein
MCSIRHGNRVYMTPSGVQKERILPEELYVLDMRYDAPQGHQQGSQNLRFTGLRGEQGISWLWVTVSCLCACCSGNKLFSPEVKPGRSNLKLTACAPLFFHSYRIRNAGEMHT